MAQLLGGECSLVSCAALHLASVADVARALHEVFVEMFDGRIAADRERYDRIAPEVWNIWQARQTNAVS